jgi:hypothetical protein
MVKVSVDSIPVAHTPEGGWKGKMPPPVLAGCDEPLVDGAPDLRGLWRAVRVEKDGVPLPEHRLMEHVERIEQAGNRVVVTSEGVIHDMRADGTLENGVDDVAAADTARRIRVAALFKDGRLELHPMGVRPGTPPPVTRERAGDELLWVYGPFRVRMRRAS